MQNFSHALHKQVEGFNWLKGIFKKLLSDLSENEH